MQGDLKLVNINDERFWDILFDEACVEGQQATRIRNELEKIIAYDVKKVMEEVQTLYEEGYCPSKEEGEEWCTYGSRSCEDCFEYRLEEIFRNGGKE